MKYFLFLFMMVATITANAQTLGNDSLDCNECDTIIKDYPLLDGVVTTSPWKGNWFVNVQAGASAFLGKPKGCGDVFDRTSFCVNASLGKWFTPGIGARIAYQGYRFKDCYMTSQKYNALHADLMYNITGLSYSYMSDDVVQSKWGVIPYFGVGIIWSPIRPGEILDCNGNPNVNHPFAFDYGVQLRYRIARRVNITAEIGGMTTYQSFDGSGVASRFGDNMFSLSAGLSFTIGKVGWKRAVDAASLIQENENLLSRIHDLEQKEWMTEYGDDTSENADNHDSFHNDGVYSGLASLRNRLKNHGKSFDSDGESLINKPAIGVPVYFFFQLNSDILVDESQRVNLDEIAKLAKEKNLIVRITGAADSATGSEEQNQALAKLRTKYIAKALLDRGVSLEQLRGYSYGGTDMYERNEENRFSRCILIEKE